MIIFSMEIVLFGVALIVFLVFATIMLLSR